MNTSKNSSFPQKAFFWLGVVTLGLMTGLGIQTALAQWSGPSVPPPNGNVAAPINTGSAAQTKAGDFTANRIISNTALVATGNIRSTNGDVSGDNVVARNSIVAQNNVNAKNNMYADDYYIRKIGKWASTLGGGSSGGGDFGNNPRWHNVKGSRAINGTYTNSTGRLMLINISLINSASSPYTCGIEIWVSGMRVMVGYANNATTCFGSAIVPNGATYTIKNRDLGSTIGEWVEFY